MKLKITNADWQTKKVKINDKTVIQRYLPARIPTFLNMERKIMKIK